MEGSGSKGGSLLEGMASRQGEAQKQESGKEGLGKGSVHVVVVPLSRMEEKIDLICLFAFSSRNNQKSIFGPRVRRIDWNVNREGADAAMSISGW